VLSYTSEIFIHPALLAICVHFNNVTSLFVVCKEIKLLEILLVLGCLNVLKIKPNSLKISKPSFGYLDILDICYIYFT